MRSLDGAMRVRIATRKSQLALWQAEHVAKRLENTGAGVAIDLVPMSTKGDRIQDRSLAAIGGKGLFIKELEEALNDGRADIAVHSMKDVPAELPRDLTIAAVLERADARDALLTRHSNSLADLPPGARIGTSSLRRQAQLLAMRPDLAIEPLRGNVDTRLRRLDAGELDAIVLASAGLIRLGLEKRISAYLPPEHCMPAVNQGIIGIECRGSDRSVLALLALLDDAAAKTAMLAERAFAARLGGSCQSPIAAHARLTEDRLTLWGLVAEPDGSRLFKDLIEGAAADAAALGEQLAERLLATDAGALLERLRGV